MAKVYKRGPKWCIRYTTASGKHVRKTIGYTRSSAEIALAEAVRVEEQIKAGILPENHHTLVTDLGELKDLYMRHQESRGASDQSLRGLELCLERCLGSLTLVRDVTLSSVAVNLTRSRAKGQSKNNYITRTKAMFNWAVTMGHIESNPIKAMPLFEKDDAKVRLDFTPEEVQRIITGPLDDPWITLWCVYAYTGLRLTPGSNMRWHWVDFRNDTISVPRKVNKGRKAHVIPLHPELRVRLLAYRMESKVTYPDDRMFPSRGPRTVAYRFTARLNAVGIDPEGHPLHAMRHTVATQVYEQGGLMAAKEILGHASVATTQGYLHTSMAQKEKAINSLSYGTQTAHEEEDTA